MTASVTTTRRNDEMDRWDREFNRQFSEIMGRLIKHYHRAELHNIDNVPATGGALVVSNHSGGIMTPDVFLFSPAFYHRFGYDRPVYTLGHQGFFLSPFSGYLRRLGLIGASRENAAAALRSGAVVLVFPGGDYDTYRPTLHANVIDFDGRTGYVRTAIDAGVPIVPTVSIGGQETQLFLTRGNRLAKKLKIPKMRMNVLPLSVGFPFGLSMIIPPNLPLPSKIVTEVLEPIDVIDRFGADPDVDEVDTYVRSIMQAALDRLATRRRFPIVG